MRKDAASKYDVIVVGAGNAALTAALAARQEGARVAVLEKAPEAERGGNSRFSGGLFRFAYEGVKDLKPLRQDLSAEAWDRVEAEPYDPAHYTDDVMRVTQGRARPGDDPDSHGAVLPHGAMDDRSGARVAVDRAVEP